MQKEKVELPKILESEAIIRFQDCDPFNHLNNGRYIDYFMNAREDQVKEHYGLDIYGMAFTSGVGWVVGKSQIAYFRPAKLMEKVIIQSQLIHFGTRDISVEMRMLSEDKQQLKAFSWVNFVHFKMETGKSELHSDELMGMFGLVHDPVQAQTFDERFGALVQVR